MRHRKSLNITYLKVIYSSFFNMFNTLSIHALKLRKVNNLPTNSFEIFEEAKLRLNNELDCANIL